MNKSLLEWRLAHPAWERGLIVASMQITNMIELIDRHEAEQDRLKEKHIGANENTQSITPEGVLGTPIGPPE